MRDPIERYLEDVAVFANLERDDERSVRAELNEHLQALLANSPCSNPQETYAMIENEFGKASKIGRGISKAKGRLRTYIKKQLRNLPLKLAVALVLAFTVRLAVAQTFYATGTGAAPLVPPGNCVMVYKLAHNFVPGDVIVYRAADGIARLGIVKSLGADHIIVTRNGGAEPDQTVPRDQIVGRVFLNTR